jgi:hypothetical protein
MKLPDDVRAEVAAEYLRAKERFPAALSSDGRAVLVDGGLGYGAYVSPEGDVFMETYDIGDQSSEVKVDRSARAQTMALVLGSKRMQLLAKLLPSRPAAAASCGPCGGEGWRHLGPTITFICSDCAGLGWLAK